MGPELKLFQPTVTKQLGKKKSYPHMVGEMVQNSQSLYSFTSNTIFVIHEYYLFTFNNRIYTQEIYLFTFAGVFLILDYIDEMSSFTFNVLYSFTFTIEIFISSTFSAHNLCASLGPSSRSTISERNMPDGG